MDVTTKIPAIKYRLISQQRNQTLTVELLGLTKQLFIVIAISELVACPEIMENFAAEQRPILQAILAESHPVLL